MRQYKFDKPLVESSIPPKSTDVYWVDIDEPTKELLNIKQFKDGAWKILTENSKISTSDIEAVWEGTETYQRDSGTTSYIKFTNLCKITPALSQEQLTSMYEALLGIMPSLDYKAFLCYVVLSQFCAFDIESFCKAVGLSISGEGAEAVNINGDNYVVSIHDTSTLINPKSEWYYTFLEEFLGNFSFVELDPQSPTLLGTFGLVTKNTLESLPDDGMISLVLYMSGLFGKSGIFVYVDAKNNIYATRFVTGD